MFKFKLEVFVPTYLNTSRGLWVAAELYNDEDYSKIFDVEGDLYNAPDRPAEIQPEFKMLRCTIERSSVPDGTYNIHLLVEHPGLADELLINYKGKVEITGGKCHVRLQDIV